MKTNEEFVLFNVYAPCEVVGQGQGVLWGTLSDRVASFAGFNICVCGDFNVVRGMEER